MYMKNKFGYVVPAYTYLFLSFTNKNQMVFIFEYNTDFEPFQEDEHNTPYSLLLLDKFNNVFEISENAYDICSISYPLIRKQENMISRQVLLDDLFECLTFGENVYDAEY